MSQLSNEGMQNAHDAVVRIQTLYRKFIDWSNDVENSNQIRAALKEGADRLLAILDGVERGNFSSSTRVSQIDIDALTVSVQEIEMKLAMLRHTVWNAENVDALVRYLSYSVNLAATIGQSFSTPSSSEPDPVFELVARHSKQQYDALMAKAGEAVEELTFKLFPQQQNLRHGTIPTRYGIVGIGYGLVDTSKLWINDRSPFRFGNNVELGLRVYAAGVEPLLWEWINSSVPRETRNSPVNIIQMDAIPNLSAATCGDGVKGSAGQGTIGCVVEKDGKKYILSNSHVLGDTTNISDPIYHPDASGSQIAALSESVNIDTTSGSINYVDAAIAEIDKSATVSKLLHSIGSIVTSVRSPLMYLSVRKHGSKTGHTVGVVMGVGVKIHLAVGTGTAQFDKQIEIQAVGGGAFAQSGDSGSLVVDAVLQMPVGLFVGADRVSAFATPIQDVLDQFSVVIA